jgi:hypothetical protein
MSCSTQASLSLLVTQGTVCRVRLDGKSLSLLRVLLGTDEMRCDHRSLFPCSFQRRSSRTDDRGRVGGYRVDTTRVASDAVSHMGGTRDDDTQLTSSSMTSCSGSHYNTKERQFVRTRVIAARHVRTVAKRRMLRYNWDSQCCERNSILPSVPPLGPGLYR